MTALAYLILAAGLVGIGVLIGRIVYRCEHRGPDWDATLEAIRAADFRAGFRTGRASRDPQHNTVGLDELAAGIDGGRQ